MKQVDTAENTEIVERTVSIRVLRVGSRQMTQSLYLQLPARHIIGDTDDYAFIGDPWGYIAHNAANCPKDAIGEAPRGAHLHVMWETEGILCRCVVTKDVDRNHTAGQKIRELEKKRHTYMQCMGAARVIEEELPAPDGRFDNVRIALPGIVNEEGEQVETYAIDKVTALWRAQSEAEYSARFRGTALQPAGAAQANNAQAKVEEARAALVSWLKGNTYAGYLAAIRATDTEIAACKAQWTAAYARLEAVGQLFIGA